MPRKSLSRQSPAPEDARRLAFNFKVSRVENAALVTVAEVRKITPQELIREQSLNDIVKDYHSLTFRLAAVGARHEREAAAAG